jgi:hypothetical protein
MKREVRKPKRRAPRPFLRSIAASFADAKKRRVDTTTGMLSGIVLALVFLTLLFVRVPRTELAMEFDENEFRKIPIGSPISDAIGAIGQPISILDVSDAFNAAAGSNRVYWLNYSQSAKSNRDYELFALLISNNIVIEKKRSVQRHDK